MLLFFYPPVSLKHFYHANSEASLSIFRTLCAAHFLFGNPGSCWWRWGRGADCWLSEDPALCSLSVEERFCSLINWQCQFPTLPRMWRAPTGSGSGNNDVTVAIISFDCCLLSLSRSLSSSSSLTFFGGLWMFALNIQGSMFPAQTMLCVPLLYLNQRSAPLIVVAAAAIPGRQANDLHIWLPWHFTGHTNNNLRICIISLNGVETVWYSVFWCGDKTNQRSH